MRIRPIMVTAALALALAATGTAAPALASTGGSTERRTAVIISALEREDLAAVSALLDPDATLTLPLSFSGRQEDAARFTGNLPHHSRLLRVMPRPVPHAGRGTLRRAGAVPGAWGGIRPPPGQPPAAIR
ncbi:hypothetical protein EDD27_0412 [Nonomuraea polychroma]|uniref:SnoaL-like protein n=1 Tax=Nonomuraea polychroma TaxID=46176 RepID=A0A438LX89_9ACTN|nr:hypothetical protein [Nonomuraea polychroma]RVX38119.1 hypothetical protein EDD27_0412 [Nonomuraea polychroma]